MSERADSLINTTSAWSELHQQHADERLETLKRREQAKNKTVTDADNKQLEKLRELDEDALNKIVQKKMESRTLEDFGNDSSESNSASGQVQNFLHKRQLKDLDRMDQTEGRMHHRLGLAAGKAKPSSTAVPITAEELARLDTHELTNQAQQLAADAGDRSGRSATNEQVVQQLMRSDVEEDALVDSVEPQDDSFEDDDEEEGNKQLDVDGFASNEKVEHESSENGDARSEPETPVQDANPLAPSAEKDNEQSVPTLPDDPDAAKAGTADSAVQANAGSSLPQAKKSIVDEAVEDAEAVKSPSVDPDDSIVTTPEVTPEDDEDDDSNAPPPLRGLYRSENTPASQHFLHASLGREGFGFQAISRALGVSVQEAEPDETEDDNPPASNFGTEVEDLAFHHQGDQEADQTLRALERNVETNVAPHQVTQSSGAFEINSDT